MASYVLRRLSSRAGRERGFHDAVLSLRALTTGTGGSASTEAGLAEAAKRTSTAPPRSAASLGRLTPVAPGGGAVGDLHPWRFRDTDRTIRTPYRAVPWFPLAAIGSVGTTTTGVARRATEGFLDEDEDVEVDVDVDTPETTIQCDSVRRKRKKKMNKHKHSKRRRLNKHKKR